MTDLNAILKKVQAATGADRELDARLWCAMKGWKYMDHNPAYGRDTLTQVAFTLPPKRTRMVTGDRGPYRHAPALSASLDAALALVGEKLPGWGWGIGKGVGACVVSVHGPADFYRATGPTPPLAVLAALLSAMIALTHGQGGK